MSGDTAPLPFIHTLKVSIMPDPSRQHETPPPVSRRSTANESPDRRIAQTGDDRSGSTRSDSSSGRDGKSASATSTLIRVLRCFTVDEPVRGVSEIAAEVGLHKSSVSRILTTLQSERLVQQDEISRKYRLSWGMLGIAGPLLSTLDVRKVAVGVLQDLRDQTRETASLIVSDGVEGISVEQAVSPQAIKHTSDMGTRYATGFSASIQVFCASLPDEKVKALLRSGQLLFTEPVDEQEYLQRLHEAVERGYAINPGLTAPDEVGIAAPVFDHRGELVAALMIAAPRYRTDDERIAEIGPLVADAAARVSVGLGYGRVLDDMLERIDADD